MTGVMAWECQGCGFPIQDGDGFLHADYADIRAALAAARRLDGDNGPTPLGEVLAGRDVQWKAHHAKCSDDPSADDGYWINVEQVRTFGQVLAWTVHLSGKTWFPLSTWPELVRASAPDLGSVAS